MANNHSSEKNDGKQMANQALHNNDTSSKETIKRGEAAIHARLKADTRPEEIKQQEEKEDAEKWRNEG